MALIVALGCGCLLFERLRSAGSLYYAATPKGSIFNLTTRLTLQAYILVTMMKLEACSLMPLLRVRIPRNKSVQLATSDTDARICTAL